MNAREILKINPVIPVIAIDDINDALPLAKALVLGGVRVLEITLRTPVGLKAIELISKEVPEAIVGAGTVINAKQYKDVVNAGAKFAISPGITEKLLKEIDYKIPLIAGIASPAELMLGLEYGLDTFKLFPASVVGGVPMLKAIYGPFSDVRFCPTGGISENNAKEYLSQPNVLCVGGSWLAPKELIKAKNWDEITNIARKTLELKNTL
ncbi:bifunctional 4-hydroxy-2-oxoglutarate aldolase/2-dehydro-3-deoxy-phosphogluconate aldolase [Campylobacter sp. 2018MI01]|uniref:bifunctional 4-hydroxy-2-oxoglutarate aldolase/2-dehydro-3-deoxy-phosphogluconate aldolase n=1 Tax=Campylobacter sp. 2018MI01 TaxID=2836735 RepID=UPI001BDA7790|nr:bifunctional 4-hydroxy-2-oxoglutarate aldolase/2-dehydro-3-deoxy-phosphogluconate aldolase [Campylobacter sp. 2018MI01]MBT0878870.1 bifunctional 4-hydroxy-2-oxoglutarate aldolase/2-dehydro-3-deoxy-phosphogluconate aldolase [Campylobacter sp. 2018MI01]